MEIRPELPDKMEGKDLIIQEAHEERLDKQLFDSMDSVDRRDRRDHITSMSSNRSFCDNYDRMNWDKI